MFSIRLFNEHLKKILGDSRNQIIRLQKNTQIHQAAYNQICNLRIKKSDLNTKSAGMFLQVIILINIDTKYTKIVSIIRLEWKNRTTNLENIILWLVKYEVI